MSSHDHYPTFQYLYFNTSLKKVLGPDVLVLVYLNSLSTSLVTDDSSHVNAA